jgi:hypothetical protein
MGALFTTDSKQINYTAGELFAIAMTAGERGNVRAFDIIWQFADIAARTARGRDVRVPLDVHPDTYDLICKYGG